MSREAALAALAAQQFDQVAPLLDTAELESTDPNVLAQWPAALHMLGHIYNNNLEDARFIWKRLPAAAKQSPEMQATWRLLQFFWNRQHAGIWQSLQAFGWSPEARPLIDALSARTREAALDLIESAYSVVGLNTVASLAGCSEGEAAQVCADRGWGVDGASRRVTVVPRPAPDAVRDGYANLQQLAEYMLHLEEH